MGARREEREGEEKSGSELEGVNWRDVHRARVGTIERTNKKREGQRGEGDGTRGD